MYLVNMFSLNSDSSNAPVRLTEVLSYLDKTTVWPFKGNRTEVRDISPVETTISNKLKTSQMDHSPKKVSTPKVSVRCLVGPQDFRKSSKLSAQRPEFNLQTKHHDLHSV
jgi:hypothetical protein